MSQQQFRKTMESQIINMDGSRTRVSKLQQSLDDMYIFIQSSTPVHQYNRPPHVNSHKHIQHNLDRYEIEIDGVDNSDIDVVLSLNNSKSSFNQNKINNYFHAKQRGTHIKIKDKYDMDQVNSHSRIRINSQNYPQNCEINYKIKYESGKQKNVNQKIQRKFNSSIQQPNYTSTKNRHQYEYNADLNNNNFNTITTTPVKQRQQKSFVLNNTNGKIIRNNNGDSNKNFKQNPQTNYKTQTQYNQQMDNSNLSQSNKNKNYSNSNSLRVQNKNDESIYKNKPYYASQSNYKNLNKDTGTMSPMVVDYEKEKNNQIDQNAIYIDEQPQNKQYQRQKIFNNKNSQYRRKDLQQYESQRTAPIPIKKISQKQREQQNVWPPSLKDIPRNSDKQVRNTYRYSNNQSKKQSQTKQHSPIVVPIQKLPSYFTKNYQNIGKEKKQPRKIQIQLKKSVNSSHINPQNKLQSPYETKDQFFINKQKYLNKLKRQQQSRSRIQNSRTLSRNSRYSISPQCQRITNRLYKNKINKQPCQKFQQQQLRTKRKQMKQLLGDYSFIRRYLSDRQIWQILDRFQRQSIPQRKWPMKLVDIVYGKLKALKSS